MPITRYNYDPQTSLLAGGFAEYYQELRRRREVEAAERTRKRKEQQRTTAIVGTAVAGAAIGAVAAPAIAAAAAPVSAGVTAGTEVGLGTGINLGAMAASQAASAGLVGAGLGAQLGAGIGEAFTTGNVQPLVGAIGDVTDFGIKTGQRAEDRAFRAAQSEKLFKQRVALSDRIAQQRVQYAKDLQSIKDSGLPFDQALEGATADLQTAIDTGARAGQSVPLPPPSTGSMTTFGPMAMGGAGLRQGMAGQAATSAGQPGGFAGPPAPSMPIDLPGPGRIPGTKRIFGPRQMQRLATLERERDRTIDNPEWVAANGPEVRSLQARALARGFQNIRTTTVPDDSPKITYPGPDGKPRQMRLGMNFMNGVDLSAGGLMFEPNGNLQWIAPYAKSEPPDLSTPELANQYLDRQVQDPELRKRAYLKNKDGDIGIEKPSTTQKEEPLVNDQLWRQAIKMVEDSAVTDEKTNIKNVDLGKVSDQYGILEKEYQEVQDRAMIARQAEEDRRQRIAPVMEEAAGQVVRLNSLLRTNPNPILAANEASRVRSILEQLNQLYDGREMPVRVKRTVAVLAQLQSDLELRAR